MISTGSDFGRYRDEYSKQSVAGSKIGEDLPRDPEAARRLKLINDGLEQNLKHQKTLFGVIIWVVVASLVLIAAINVCISIWGTHLESAVLISLNASVAVQSFLLLGVIARSLFPSSAKQRAETTKEN